nr:vacuolar protein sorting-associated protein 20 homolog 2-like [Tanacetum cinerariifolium]
LDKVIEAKKEAAKALLREKKKDMALLALKKKKIQEDLLKQVDGMLVNVEHQLADIEIASKQKAVFESLKAGNNAIKAIQGEINLDDVQKLMDDTAEAKAYQDEINALLGEKLSDEDEEDVLVKFDSLEAEMTIQDLPEAPLSEPPSTQDKEKLDLPDVPTKTPEIVVDKSQAAQTKGDLDGSKSTTRYLFTLYGGTVSWVSRLQSIMAMSTTKAEYVAAAQAMKESVWLKMFLEELAHKQDKITLFCDN